MPANIGVQLPPTTVNMLDAMVERYGVSKSVVVQRAVNAYLRGQVKVPGLPELKPDELGTGTSTVAVRGKPRRRGMGD